MTRDPIFRLWPLLICLGLTACASTRAPRDCTTALTPINASSVRDASPSHSPRPSP